MAEPADEVLPRTDVQDERPNNAQEAASLRKIQQLLQAKDDTSRFVGLALLKSTLDNSAALQGDKAIITTLWNSISTKFLDRLLRTGSRRGEGQQDAKEMLNLSVSVIYTFTVLLSGEAADDDRLLGRIPRLVEALVQSSGETTEFVLKTLLTLVSSPKGGHIFLEVDDWSPLVEVAPKEEHALSVLLWAWLQGNMPPESRPPLRARIDKTIAALIVSYRGTDAVTLLDFIDKALGRLAEDLIPSDARWLPALVDLVRALATNRPTSSSREAYTKCAARLLITYPDTAPAVLFGSDTSASKPFSYLFINLMLIDVRASLPTLLEKLNSPEYPAISTRLTSALLVLSSFITYLLRQLDLEESQDGDAFTASFNITPELLLKLNRSISETLSVLMEFLRDRWDAAVAGAHGLHREARMGEAHTASGTLRTLAWDSKHDSATADEDPLVLASLKVLGVWLSEDDGDELREEASGLCDMMVDLYRTEATAASAVGVGGHVSVGYRTLVLRILSGVVQTAKGLEAMLEQEGWTMLSQDLLAILNSSAYDNTSECEVGQLVSALLSGVLDSEGSPRSEDWMDFVTGVAASNWLQDEEEDKTAASAPAALQLLWADVLSLAAGLLSKANGGMKRRYVHSAASVKGIARAVQRRVEKHGEARQVVEDALDILEAEPLFNI